jgi:hypothetical protein
VRTPASAVDVDREPDQHSRSNYLLEHQVGQPPGLFSDVLLSYRRLFLKGVRRLHRGLA